MLLNVGSGGGAAAAPAAGGASGGDSAQEAAKEEEKEEGMLFCLQCEPSTNNFNRKGRVGRGYGLWPFRLSFCSHVLLHLIMAGVLIWERIKCRNESKSQVPRTNSGALGTCSFSYLTYSTDMLVQVQIRRRTEEYIWKSRHDIRIRGCLPLSNYVQATYNFPSTIPCDAVSTHDHVRKGFKVFDF